MTSRVVVHRQELESGARPPDRLGALGDLSRFTAAVALAAIFVDAALGHASLCENDPSWTYWITKTTRSRPTGRRGGDRGLCR